MIDQSHQYSMVGQSFVFSCVFVRSWTTKPSAVIISFHALSGVSVTKENIWILNSTFDFLFQMESWRKCGKSFDFIFATCLTCLFTICGKLEEKLFQIWYSNQFLYISISICFGSPRLFQFTLRIFPTVKDQFFPQNIPLITCIWIGFFITSFILFISEYSQ